MKEFLSVKSIYVLEYCNEFKIDADFKVFDFSDFELKEVKTLI